MLDGRQCIDDPNSSTTNATKIQVGTATALELGNSGFSSRDVQFTSTGAGQVQVVGECLDAPSGAERTRIQVNDCNGTTVQQVTVTNEGSCRCS